MTEYQVGKYYRVPCLLLRRNNSLAPGTWQRTQGGRWVPIIGPLHDDKQFFNFAERHYHPDVRFMSRSLPQWYVPRWAAPRDGLPLEQEAMRFPMAVEGHFVRIASREPVQLRRKCQR